MSRNSRRRTTVPQAPEPRATSPSSVSRTAENPFGISFVVPTEVVELPSQGKYYSENSSMFGKSTLEIKQMTAKEEEILSNISFVEDGSMIDRLLSSILIDKTVTPEDIMAADKNALVFAARKSSYGPEYKVKQFCYNCNSEQEFIFDLTKCKIKTEIDEDILNEETTGFFTFDLPQSKLKVTIKVLLPEDEEYLQEQADRARKLNIEQSSTLNFLRRIVVDVDNVTDPKLLNQLFEVLPVLDIRKIKSVSNQISPSLETNQEITCGNCGHVTESEVPFSLGFFWPEL
tara:strand:- start:1 stop:864 length:864 start_codon:yes stop_codon:yes gene_type:complete